MIFPAKTRFENFCLNFYLKVLLELIACCGEPAYKFVKMTGHLFRSEDVFASTMGKTGVLKSAVKNLKAAHIVEYGMEKAVINDYTKFESRFALENIWIRKGVKNRIIGAFNSNDVRMLNEILLNRQFIIATLHTSAMYSFVALIKNLGYNIPFVVMNPLAGQITDPSPFQKVLLRLFPRWIQTNEFIFVQEGNVLERCERVINSGRSLIIAPDTPFYSKNNVVVEFMGRKTGVASGAGFLSQKYKLDILSVSHWAEDCTYPYTMDMKIIKPTEVAKNMQKVFSFFQKGIERNPACWNGWLYWDQMDHKEEVYGNT